ncbi:PEP-CTERM sorting domain-containing protein [Singulisphaera acidiphila]|uniref:PEP-CTERM putative exosortase interaction domain-containing protein n=1 Tax=Singulisphaera acidiphila (strain ATCC BAA-1392 / DSM 18658 / VKM B-2454 / MOB10) TaxID=886293 RepID=L0DBM1_SINAD|nr:PEP-CTERM sorting domain-containing protein [Singulisphaera acidiphila]AGA26774.1 PEP-CTERM putative exosortase interaction domain-containing protein [Singulisphaera acidiphila DSM 18658]
MTRTYVKGLAVIAVFLALTASSAPASTPIDLTTAGATFNLNAQLGGNFIVQQTNINSSGAGSIDPFVQLQAEGKSTSAEGYNTDARPVQFDANSSPQVTHSLLLSDVPVVNINGTNYRQFVLDVNPSGQGNVSNLSLNQVQIFLANTNELTGAVHLFDATSTTPPVVGFLVPNSTEVFRMNDSTSNFLELQLQASQNSHGNTGGMFLYVPDSTFQAALATNPDQQYVYLYSQFGTPPGSYPTQCGSEEWGVLKTPPNPVPEPSTVALALTGLGTLGLAGLRRRHLSSWASN